jgi:cytochrome bd-type quinol oxidase subunit 2
MEETKKWWQSIGVIGSIIATVSPVIMIGASFLGYMVTPADIQEASGLFNQLQAVALSVAAIVGGAVAWWGRVRATKKIG